MESDEARDLLGRIGIFRHSCDLDLFFFFIAHPRTILSTESLATFLGYDLKQLTDSLETLRAARLLNCTQTSMHAARLYVLKTDNGNAVWLSSFLDMASTRQGRAELRKVLRAPSREEDETENIGRHHA